MSQLVDLNANRLQSSVEEFLQIREALINAFELPIDAGESLIN
jgi:hypothetical protein